MDCAACCNAYLKGYLLASVKFIYLTQELSTFHKQAMDNSIENK